jgi:Ala-tRNA(Pro) deacylase
MAVLAASHRISFPDLREKLEISHLETAGESELASLCSDCELGALPPFGNLYGMEVWVDSELTRSPEIIFNAGTHGEALRMKYADYASRKATHRDVRRGGLNTAPAYDPAFR